MTASKWRLAYKESPKAKKQNKKRSYNKGTSKTSVIDGLAFLN